MLPADLVDADRCEGRVVPRYLTTRDHGWVQALQDELEGAVGQPREAVDERLVRLRLPGPPRRRAAAAMTTLLLRRHTWRTESAVDPVAARAAVFELAGRERAASREDVLRRVADQAGVHSKDLAASLYADLPARRRLEAPGEALTTADALARYNLALAQSLLLRAERLRVEVGGQAKQVLRYARLHGLLVRVLAPADRDARTVLEVSGPLSLLRSTLKYGRAMARWLPALTRLPQWSLSARCVLDGEVLTFDAGPRDPLGTTHAVAKRFDSQVEARFFRDLKRVGGPWQVLREAAPVQLGRRLVCPDFTLVDAHRARVVPVEIVGYWTPEYLADKLRVLAALPPRRPWLLCVDESLAGALAERLPSDRVFWYRRRIDAPAFLAWVEAQPLAPGWPGSIDPEAAPPLAAVRP